MPNSKTIGVAYSDPALSGATLDDSVIGGTTAAAGTFTNLTSTGNSRFGNTSADTVGFYTVAGVAQSASSNQAAVATVAAITAGGAYGFANAAQANGLVTLVNQIRTDLVALGLIKGSS